MTKRKPRLCTAPRCEETPYLGGLCKEHYEEQECRRRKENAAVDFLHSRVIEGQVIQHAELKEEANDLFRWWDRVCRAVQARRDVGHMPFDEADYAISWCCSIAQRIIEAELAYRAGKEVSPMLKAEREPFWERFRNLEVGLASNGVPRRNNN